MPSERCFVYMMQCGKFIKIGIAGSVPARRAHLQTATPYEVTVARQYGMGDRRWAQLAERAAHEDLGQYRVQGEWFDVDFDVALEAVEFFVENARKLRKERKAQLKARADALWRQYIADKAFQAKVDEEFT